MDRIDRMRLYVRVVERGSFTAAAADLRLPRSTATEAIRALEAYLGVRLLERTTRHVAPTDDGRGYYGRCVTLLAELDDADGTFRAARPRGRLRVHAQGLVTRTFLLPRLSGFLDRHPLIELHLGQGDRLVDLVREGVDCVVRVGAPKESGLVLHGLGAIRQVTVASPAYLERYGTPLALDDIARHVTIGCVPFGMGRVVPLRFKRDGEVIMMLPTSRMTVDNIETMTDLARLGLGLVQAPRFRFAADLADGTLVEVLPAHPPPSLPLAVLYPERRRPAPRLRAFIDWIDEIFRGSDV